MGSAEAVLERQEEQRVSAMKAVGTPPGSAPAMWYCEDCLVAIPDARRLAVPGCTRCVECQERVEGRA